ncbi:(+)-delta-cadinene synthase isozyme A-like [Gossypium australe]|uniref:(+)-delta-cadinene synthase isozyme A-like n=1 Tax=Gossypium australe TaxID=47621 RepID=A0A5B6VU37_9ROSI|nr:(+)-delta-cadinene synthase isozyme A-like [Gossypium australe]
MSKIVQFNSTNLQNVDAKTKLQHEELKEEVRRMIKVVMDDELLYKLRLIDTIKQLGVSYHFEREIEEVLLNIYEHDYKDDQTLETTLFNSDCLERMDLVILLVSPFSFLFFTSNLVSYCFCDVKGLLELHESSHLRVHGEDILEEALDFTTTHLGLAKASGTIEYLLSALVSHALYKSIRKGLPRLEAKRFISIYQGDASHNKTLLKFAELDFNLRKKGLDLTTKLPFVRDRLVEGYFWMLGVYFEPQYSFARRY